MSAGAHAGTINWDGDNGIGNFTYDNNWYGDGSYGSNPENYGGWNFGNELQFNVRNNGAQSSLFYDLGWRDINSIRWMPGFGAGLDLNGNGNGINFGWGIVNESSYTQTVNIPLSGGKNGAGSIRLDPINGDLVFNSNVFNDNNKSYEVYGDNSKLLTINGDLKGNGSVALTIKEYSKVLLNSSQTFGGSVSVDEGEFWVGENGNWAGSSAFVGVNSGSDTRTAKLWIQDANGGKTVTQAITMNDSAGSQYRVLGGLNTSGENTFDGNITLNGNVELVANESGGTVNFGGVISGSGKSVSLTGPGAVKFSDAMTYSGNTYINNGKLQIAAGGDIQNSSQVYLGSSFNVFSSTLEISGSGVNLDRNISVEASAGAGTRTLSAASGTGAATVSGNVTMSRDLTVTANSGSSIALSSVTMNTSGNNDLAINGAGDVSIAGTLAASTGDSDVNKSGAGTLVISGNNASSFYRLNIADGAVDIASTAAFGAQSVSFNDKVNFTGSGTLGITGNTTLNGNMGFKVGSGQTGTFDVDNGVTFTVGGALANISGSGNFIKTGAGTMVLSGSSSYSGSMTVNQGTLDVQGTLTPSSGLSVSGTGKVVGDGTLGSLTIASGGVLSPGNSPGTLNVASATWGTGGTYIWEINDFSGTQGADPGWDLLNVSGALTISATTLNPFVIDVTSLNGVSAGSAANFNSLSSYTRVIATAAGGVSGFAANKFSIDLSGFQNPNSLQWAIQQTGNDIELVYTAGAPESAVPEPSVVMLMASALLVGVGLRRRIRRA